MNHPQRVSAFRTFCMLAGNLFALRNTQYGDAIKETGVLGATVELVAVVARLKQLVLKMPNEYPTDKEQLEQICNAFIDAHNYANIGLMMLDEENWNGK